jgi:NAD(P)-dependent dehydrogenase (short-subunit alcohol dehydrogenase family)
MVGMTKTIARGYAHENVLAFAVCPGFTMTGMAEDYVASRGGDKLLADIPLGRVASVDEVAETVRWLAVDAPPSATGRVIDVNGASYVDNPRHCEERSDAAIQLLDCFAALAMTGRAARAMCGSRG